MSLVTEMQLAGNPQMQIYERLQDQHNKPCTICV